MTWLKQTGPLRAPFVRKERETPLRECVLAERSVTAATVAAAAVATATAIATTAAFATATATVATTAAFATAAATTTTVAATAATTTVAAAVWAAETSRTLFTWACFVDDQGATSHGLTVEAVDGGLRFSVGAHFHETETLGAASFTVHHDLGGANGTILGKSVAQILITHGVGQIAHVKFVAHE